MGSVFKTAFKSYLVDVLSGLIEHQQGIIQSLGYQPFAWGRIEQGLKFAFESRQASVGDPGILFQRHVMQVVVFHYVPQRCFFMVCSVELAIVVSIDHCVVC